jgi:hypothetical protein
MGERLKFMMISVYLNQDKHAEIQRQVDAFLARGGKIKKLAITERAEEPVKISSAFMPTHDQIEKKRESGRRNYYPKKAESPEPSQADRVLMKVARGVAANGPLDASADYNAGFLSLRYSVSWQTVNRWLDSGLHGFPRGEKSAYGEKFKRSVKGKNLLKWESEIMATWLQ